VTLHVMAVGYRSDLFDFTLSTRSEPPHLRVELVPDGAAEGEVSIAGRVVGASPARVRLYAPHRTPTVSRYW